MNKSFASLVNTIYLTQISADSHVANLPLRKFFFANNLYKNLIKSKSIMLFMDLTKAFDVAQHEILFLKWGYLAHEVILKN